MGDVSSYVPPSQFAHRRPDGSSRLRLFDHGNGDRSSQTGRFRQCRWASLALMSNRFGLRARFTERNHSVFRNARQIERKSRAAFASLAGNDSDEHFLIVHQGSAFAAVERTQLRRRHARIPSPLLKTNVRSLRRGEEVFPSRGEAELIVSDDRSSHRRSPRCRPAYRRPAFRSAPPSDPVRHVSVGPSVGVIATDSLERSLGSNQTVTCSVEPLNSGSTFATNRCVPAVMPVAIVTFSISPTVLRVHGQSHSRRRKPSP